jgi:hypothetical protein
MFSAPLRSEKSAESMDGASLNSESIYGMTN